MRDTKDEKKWTNIPVFPLMLNTHKELIKKIDTSITHNALLNKNKDGQYVVDNSRVNEIKEMLDLIDYNKKYWKGMETKFKRKIKELESIKYMTDKERANSLRKLISDDINSPVISNLKKLSNIVILSNKR